MLSWKTKISAYLDEYLHTNLFQNLKTSIVCHKLVVANDLLGTSWYK